MCESGMRPECQKVNCQKKRAPSQAGRMAKRGHVCYSDGNGNGDQLDDIGIRRGCEDGVMI
jgi:hypothetical protein